MIVIQDVAHNTAKIDHNSLSMVSPISLVHDKGRRRLHRTRIRLPYSGQARSARSQVKSCTADSSTVGRDLQNYFPPIV